MRFGNVLAPPGATSSALTSSSKLLRYTAGAAVRMIDNVRRKASAEYYQFSDLPGDVALHLAVATPF